MWFRDYVYFPLGGSRVSSVSRLLFNLFAVWLLTGIWHGANWTFICWGLFYFIFIVIEKITGFENLAIPDMIKRVYILLIVMIGWVLFRADTIADAGTYLSVMFGFSGNPFIDVNAIVYLQENLVYYLFGFLFSAPAAKAAAQKFENMNIGKAAVSTLYIIVFAAVFLLTLSNLVKGTYNPFIYFNF
jgi:alginate O-acetyltransferase complex protein AlgI